MSVSAIRRHHGPAEPTKMLIDFHAYSSRGIDISICSQASLGAIARQIDERPGKTLQYQTPAEAIRAMSCRHLWNVGSVPTRSLIASVKR